MNLRRSAENPIREKLKIASWIGAGAITAYATARVLSELEFDRESRRLIALLHLRPGMDVADVGAGRGGLTIRVGKHVGPDGRVFATEIDRGRLAAIRRAVANQHLSNVTVMQAPEQSTGLPDDCCDAIFLRGVYHHFTYPTEMDDSLFRAVRSGGMVAIIDFPPRLLLKPWTPKGVPKNRGGHGIPRDILAGEMSSAGFEIVSETDWPGWQYCILFRKGNQLPLNQ